MKELKEELNWFSKWEEQLPSPDELMPLTQTLIPPHLLLAFDLPTQFTPNPPLPHKITQTPDFDSSDLGSGDDPARTLKRPRLVWTPQLHKRFVDAVAHLGIKNAVPKTIMQLMSVDGLTRENVASHLQKYRLYLKRMQQGHSAGDSATDHLFASSPVPPHFLRPNSDQFLPFVPVAALQQQHHHQQMAAAAGHLQYGQMGHLVVPVNGPFEHPFLARQQPPHQLHRMGTPLHKIVPSSYAEDLEPATPAANGRKALTLFPTEAKEPPRGLHVVGSSVDLGLSQGHLTLLQFGPSIGVKSHIPTPFYVRQIEKL